MFLKKVQQNIIFLPLHPVTCLIMNVINMFQDFNHRFELWQANILTRDVKATE